MNPDDTPNHTDHRRRVRAEIPARMIQEFEDGTARVDAAGIEIPVEPDEWWYVDSDGSRGDDS